MKLTAKEKAKDLIEKFRDENNMFEEATVEAAKYFAVICVDEILEGYNPLEYYPEDLRGYWEGVKKEIELL